MIGEFLFFLGSHHEGCGLMTSGPSLMIANLKLHG